jgi:hypothetical protein
MSGPETPSNATSYVQREHLVKASPNLPEKKPPAPSVKVRKGSDQQNIAGQVAEPPSRQAGTRP